MSENQRPYTFYEASAAEKRFVARLIKEARFARGLTPIEAAKAIGISRQVYYRWEAGRFGSATTKVVCWLLKDNSDRYDAAYWRERALLAERRLGAIHEHLQAYAASRRMLEGAGASEPSSVSPREGSRVRAA